MNGYRFAADFILVLHTVFIGFVVLGLIVILVGMARHWHWVRNFWFRVAHLAAIAYVVVQSLCGLVCPLTTLENNLRMRGGQQAYAEGGFIEFWLHKLIFFSAEPWVFTACYTAFGLLVAATMWYAPPRWPWGAADHASHASVDPMSSRAAPRDLGGQVRGDSEIPRSSSG